MSQANAIEDFLVLVIDRDPVTYQRVSRIMEGHKMAFPFFEQHYACKVYSYPEPFVAIQKILVDKPQIVLLDDSLPNIETAAIIESIRDSKLDTLVIEFISQANVDQALKANIDGAFDFLPKPFAPFELKTSIENAAKQFLVRSMARNLNREGRQVRFQFLSVLSHELKAPLNAIEGYLNIMKAEELGGHIADYTEIIERSLTRIAGMRNLILDMLDITRIENGKRERVLEKLSIEKILNLSLDTLHPMAIQKGVDFIIDITPNLTFNGNAEDFEIIFNNLLSNAVKYNKDGGKVQVTISKIGGELQMEISDNGIGMSAEESAKIFGDFVRIKNNKTKKISGTGLGLSIVKKLVQLYNGEIAVKSEPDKGTSFYISMPENQE